MGENLRKSGINFIGNLPWGSHVCQFYQTMKDLKDILAPYIEAGLESNEFCIWVPPQSLSVKEAKEVLWNTIPEIDAYLDKGQVEIISCTNWYLDESYFDSNKVLNLLAKKLKYSLENGYEGLRLIENVPSLGKENLKIFTDYEGKLDNFIKKIR